MGLVLSDLEATYHWRKWLQKRPFTHYLVLTTALLCALGATLFSVFNNKWSFNTAENSIHPDQLTGKPLRATEGGAVYPSYQEPTLAILLFSIGAYAAVYGVTYAYVLHHLANILCAWLVAIHFDPSTWSSRRTNTPIESRTPDSETKKRP